MEELQRKVENQKFLLENIIDVIWILDIDSMQFTYVSSSVQQLRGYTVDEALAQRATEMIAPGSQNYLSTLLPHRLSLFMENGHVKTHTDEVEQTCKDGSTVWTEIVSDFRHNPESKRIEIIGTSRNISSRIQTQNFIYQQKAIFSSIFNNGDTIIFSVDHSYLYTNFNQAHANVMDAIYGAKIKIGKCLLDYMTVKVDRDKAKQNIDKALAGEKFTESAFSGEELRSRVYFEVLHNPIITDDGKIIGASIVSSNITERQQSIQALAESEYIYSNIIKTSLDGFWIAGFDAKFKDVNDAYCNMIGYSREELLKMSIPDIEVIEKPEETKQHIENIQKTGSDRFETKHRRKDGKIIDVEINVTTSKFGKGEMIVFVKDVTERKNAEKDVRETNYRLNMATEFANVAVWDWNAKTDVTIGNSIFGELLGFTETDNVYKNWVAELHPEDKTKVLEKFTAHLKGKAEKYEAEFRFNHSKKGWVWLKSTGKLVEWDKEGKPFRMLGTTIDTTEQVTALEAIKWNAKIDHALTAMYEPLANPTTIINNVSSVVNEQARLLTQSKHGFVSVIDPKTGDNIIHTITEMVDDLTRMKFPKDKPIILPRGKNGLYNGLWGHALNTLKPFFTNNTPHKTSKGLPKGHIPVLKFLSVPVITGGDLVGQIALANPESDYQQRDLDAIVRLAEFYGLAIQRIRAEEEIKKYQDHLEDLVQDRTADLESFSYSVSHDLRAPLRSINGFSNALLEDYNDKFDEEGKDFLNRIRNAAKHMGDLIDSLLGLSRITRYEMNIKKLDLSLMANKVISELQETGEYNNVEVDVTPGLSATADSKLMEIALQNLLSNAFKYSSKESSPKVEFGIKGKENSSVFFVRDNGVGFNMDYVDKVFTPFQRLHSSDEFKGIGIGLANVKRVISRHNGKIWVESEIGKGVTFYFTLK